MRLLTLGLVALSMLSACSQASVSFPIGQKSQTEIVAETHVDIIRLNPMNVDSFSKQRAGPLATTLPAAKVGEYRIGPGDVLSVFVFDHPELAVPSSVPGSGFVVRSDGSMAFPFLLSVQAGGKTVEELRLEMAQGLAKFFNAPQVDVRVQTFNAQRVVVAGEVARPSTLSLDTNPKTLLQAVNDAGGLSATADAHAIKVRRGGKSYTVDLAAYMTGQVSSNNPFVTDGDLISVPRLQASEAYLLGEIRAPAAVDLSRDVISVTQAITRQGGIDQERADARGVFVFRNVGDKVTVYQLDITSPTGLLLGTRFELEPQDVVYITTWPLQRWNDTIRLLLPTVGAYGAAQSTIP